MADRYWVGGTGTWDSVTTTNWSATSGGIGGASVPTYADNVIFDTLSNATAYTVTFAQGFVGAGSISGTTLTVTSMTSGTITVGSTINRPGITPLQPTSTTYIAGGTYIVNQLTGTAGGVGTYTVNIPQTSSQGTFSGSPSCLDISVSGPILGAVTFAGALNTRPSIYGSLTLAATGVVWSSISEVIFCANTTGKVITTNGVAFGGGNTECITFDGVGGGWTLGSSFTVGFTTNTFTLRVNRGDFNTGNFAVTAAGFNSLGTFTRSITLGTSAVTITNPNIEVWNVTNTGLTLSAGTSTITLNSFNAKFTGGGLAYNNLVFSNSGAVSQDINGANTFNNLTLATRSGDGLSFMRFSADQTITGTLTMGVPTSSNVNIRRFLKSSVDGVQRTLTVASVAAFASADFRDIVIAGAAAPISGTSLGNAGNNSGITFTAPKTVYWNLAAGGQWGSSTIASWATTSGGAVALANLPLAQDTAIIGDTGLNSGATITNKTSTNAYLLGNVDLSARTSPMTLAFLFISSFPVFYGALLLSAAVTLTGVTLRTGTASDSVVISDTALGQVLVTVTSEGSLLITGTAENTPFKFELTADGILTGIPEVSNSRLFSPDYVLSAISILLGNPVVQNIWVNASRRRTASINENSDNQVIISELYNEVELNESSRVA